MAFHAFLTLSFPWPDFRGLAVNSQDRWLSRRRAACPKRGISDSAAPDCHLSVMSASRTSERNNMHTALVCAILLR